MSEPAFTCPNCRQETKLTESLAAPLLESTRRQFEQQLAQKDQDIARREQARKEAEEAQRLEVAEKQQTIAAMQKQIEDLKRRAGQGSQQLQGEVQEPALVAQLRSRFPFDVIEPVPEGEFGGDVLQRVVAAAGQACGAILWESKRTKNWNDAWLVKLREDQRCARAEIAVIVSQALPKDVDAFVRVEGVWVVHPRTAIPVAAILRQSLLDVATARSVAEGRQGKTEMVYR